jgi:hypothetical protein
MALLDDVITYLEMREAPTTPRIPAPPAKLALMRAENCTVSFYRYLYETVGTPWLWYERRLTPDEALVAEIGKPTTEIFVLTVGGVRYLTAQGNPRAVEEAKAGIKAALIGYGLAALAPTLVSILQKVLRT